MSSALSTAVNGINASVAHATHAAASIVKASSTGTNVDTSLVKIKAERTAVAAEAAVIKTEAKNQKALLDIKV